MFIAQGDRLSQPGGASNSATIQCLLTNVNLGFPGKGVHPRVETTRCGLKERWLPVAGGRPDAEGAWKAPLLRSTLQLSVSTRRCTLRVAGQECRLEHLRPKELASAFACRLPLKLLP